MIKYIKVHNAHIITIMLLLVKANCTQCVYVDTNECELGAGCDHECTNTQGSYVCSCRLGYNLDTDNHTCSGTDLLSD